MASTYRDTANKVCTMWQIYKKKRGGGAVRICLLTSFGCESTTFWQMLCSCVMSLTRPKFFSWMICWAVLPDDLHISWKTWEHGSKQECWASQPECKRAWAEPHWVTDGGGITARFVQLTDLLGNWRRDTARFLEFQQLSQRRGRDGAEIKRRGSVITVYEGDWKTGAVREDKRVHQPAWIS